MIPISPAIILVRPQMGENIGGAARAMLNFGLTDLRLVAPRDGWPNPASETMAAGALDVINTQVFATLEEAIADLHFLVATTARPRGMVKTVYEPREAAQENYRRMQEEQKTGFVFGPERSGLENDDIARCHAIVTIPVNENFSSLNLSAAVLLMAYESALAGHTPAEPTLETNGGLPASQKNMESFLSRLEQALDENGFFRSADHAPIMKRNIRNIFIRSDLTEQEVNSLHGVIKSLAEYSS
ncbi:MAG: RNA methyltransferase [Alphaproteobacteria bacterium]